MTNEVIPFKLNDGPESDDIQIQNAEETLKSMLELFSGELKDRFEDPIKAKRMLKRMHPDELLKNIMRIMGSLKKPGFIVATKGFQLNMSQVNHYANAIINDPLKKQELRNRAKKQLKNIRP